MAVVAMGPGIHPITSGWSHDPTPPLPPGCRRSRAYTITRASTFTGAHRRRGQPPKKIRPKDRALEGDGRSFDEVRDERVQVAA
jgi:hypothetical protein